MTRERQSAVLRFLMLDDDELIRQCEVDHYRASGPGGQKRNKTSTAVRLRHLPTGLVATAADDRSQRVNTIRAVRRLRRTIALQVRTTVDPGSYRRSAMLDSYITTDGEIRVSQRNPDYHLIVCEIVDLFKASNARVSDAANCIGVSTGHLVAFFKRDPKLWECINRLRREVGIKTLR